MKFAEVILVSLLASSCNTRPPGIFDELSSGDTIWIFGFIADCGEFGGHHESFEIYKQEDQVVLQFVKDSVECPDLHWQLASYIVVDTFKKLNDRDLRHVNNYYEALVNSSEDWPVSNRMNSYWIDIGDTIIQGYGMFKEFNQLVAAILDDPREHWPPLDTLTARTEQIFVEEVHPQYVGGEEALMKFIQENVRYPDGTREEEIEGTVYVQFMVGADGNVTDGKIMRGIGGGCDEEVLRVVNLLPRWKPAVGFDGQPRSAYFTMPVVFTLEESSS